MEFLLADYRYIFKDKSILRNILGSVLLFALSLIATTIAYGYTKTTGGHITQDIILDNIPVFDVSIVFFGSIAFLTISAVLLGFLFPRKIPFGFETTAIFFFVRSFFMVLTHLAPPNVQYYQYIQHEHHVRNILFTVSSGTDLFFSGHTGFPFLLALIFWEVKSIRYFFIGFSVLMAATVLLGHLHYSIDVFAAYFITYGVYRAAEMFLQKEYFIMDRPSLLSVEKSTP